MIHIRGGNDDYQIAKCQFPPFLETPLPCNLVVDHDYARNNILKQLGRPLKQPGVEHLHVISGDIPPNLSPKPLHPDSASNENGGGGSRNINAEETHRMAKRDGNEDSEVSRDITLDKLVAKNQH